MLINEFILELVGKDKWWINLNELFFFGIKFMGERCKLGKGFDLNGFVIFLVWIFLKIFLIIWSLFFLVDFKLEYLVVIFGLV